MEYQVYHNKRDSEIKVTPLQKIFKRGKMPFDSKGIYSYNSFYYFCKDRITARDLARDIRTKWITELESKLAKINEIKI
jgi:hypothetical protein